MEAALAENNNDIDAVLSENDGMATGVVAALEAQGLDSPGRRPGRRSAALNRVALGTQTVSVWKNANDLGTAAGEAAIALCRQHGRLGRGRHRAVHDPLVATKSHPSCSSRSRSLKDNLNAVVDAGWITTETLCQGVTAGSVPACP